jgi:hypothetical protein
MGDLFINFNSKVRFHTKFAFRFRERKNYRLAKFISWEIDKICFSAGFPWKVVIRKKGHIFNPIQKFMHRRIDNIVFEKLIDNAYFLRK